MRSKNFIALLLLLASLFFTLTVAVAEGSGAFDTFISTLESWGKTAAGITGYDRSLEDISLFTKFVRHLRLLAEDWKLGPFAFIMSILRFLFSLTPFAGDGNEPAEPLPLSPEELPEQTFSL